MDDLKKLSNQLHTWLDHYRSAARIAPSVQEAAEEVDWQISVLEARPTEAYSVPMTRFDERARFALQSVGQLLPEMPEYRPGIDLRINSITSSTGISANNYIVEVADLGTPSAVDWARRAQEGYQALQTAHRRHERVRELLLVRFPLVVGRFDAAVVAYQQARLNVGHQSGAALEMRTVLDGIQGELFERARQNTREKMTWSVMSSRLAPGSTADTLLRSEESNRRSLYEDLSAVAKQRGARSIEALWSRTVDHLFVVLAETT
ncbi:MAG: hypothetical protein ABMA15_22360 [Vicinamibacterales bacterium]